MRLNAKKGSARERIDVRDFFKQSLTVGKSKTAAGTGRTIPLKSQFLRTLTAYRVWCEATLVTYALILTFSQVESQALQPLEADSDAQDSLEERAPKG